MKRSADRSDDAAETSAFVPFLDTYWALVAVVVVLLLVAAGIGLSVGLEEAPTRPQVSWETQHHPENAAVAVVHGGGEPVDATHLRVDVAGSDAAVVSSPSGNLTPGDRLVVRPVESGDDAEIVYVHPDDGRETVLYSWRVG